MASAGQGELSSINSLFEDANISTHPIIRELEKAYRERIRSKYALAHNNGTSALMAAFWALDLKPGDQILVPTATFWASALPMMWHGLVPIFCESEDTELGLDLEDIRAKWNPNVKAIVIVPLWGIPGNYEAILNFAKEKRLLIIEDASHAHGAQFKNKPVGSFGDISVFSLQGDKLAPAGEGGMLLTNNLEYYNKAILFGDITRIVELDTPDSRFAATSFGVKTRIAPVSASIGLNSLKKLDERNAIRKSNMIRLSEALENYGFNCYTDTENWSRTYFEFVARPQLNNKNKLTATEWVKALLSEGCDVSEPRYPLLHEQPFFTEGAYKKVLRLDDSLCPEYNPGGFDKTRKVNGELIKFPCFTTTHTDLLDEYIDAIHKIGRSQDVIKTILENS
ncbi:DegT/DnrJ/EryC1/StrS family aminotransferase [Carboxylicivirga marina]|uniref:DegT/DnrJ/EryC1/StrS family aminotransferase n=1 Tax=Carboxylicivirga marina TaxID=2800988 RepID=A0ABS1HE77_9BACT|nr:DegT/DnrJ/EryC1/StrS family aminotransferase [Carboxylicivirga marina]MBK3515972.1 DegT/DnrJ/EryC1/StrS family aminotransferase [Carboxylicivirga marina]